jgi:hypothetical protein
MNRAGIPQVPAQFTELLGAALLWWLESLDSPRVTRSRTERLAKAVDGCADVAESWPEAATDLLERSLASVNGHSGSALDKAAIIDATEVQWPGQLRLIAGDAHFNWQDRADLQ